MKNKEILGLYEGLNSVGQLGGVKFAYAVTKSKKKLEPEIEAIQEVVKPKEGFIKYDSDRMELAKEHAEKDEDGNPITEKSNYKIEDLKKFAKALDKLKESHTEALAEREKQVIDYNELLEEEVKVELHKVHIDEVPENITANQLESIIEIITEDDVTNS